MQYFQNISVRSDLSMIHIIQQRLSSRSSYPWVPSDQISEFTFLRPGIRAGSEDRNRNRNYRNRILIRSSYTSGRPQQQYKPSTVRSVADVIIVNVPSPDTLYFFCKVHIIPSIKYSCFSPIHPRRVLVILACPLPDKP